ncbi:hypothetical protein P7C70_g1666, partial [Phenoliferia sp. Uapishka_3]
MATINELPSETLFLIFKLLPRTRGDPSTHDRFDWAAHRQRSATLSSACSVSKQWKRLAEPLLWQSILIYPYHTQSVGWQHTIRAILRSSALGRFKTRQLVVREARFKLNDTDDDEEDSPSLKDLLDGLKGLESLYIQDSKLEEADAWIGTTWLGSTNLQAGAPTTRLASHGSAFHNPSSTSLTSTWHLSHLNLGPEMCSSSLIEPIFVASSTTLTALTVNFSAGGAEDAICDAMPLLAKCLESLVVIGDLYGGSSKLRAAVSSLTRLRNVKIIYDDPDELDFLDAFLLALPSSLTSTKISLPLLFRTALNSWNNENLRDRIGKKKGWDRVNELSFKNSMAEILENPGGLALFEFCESAEIKMIFEAGGI